MKEYKAPCRRCELYDKYCSISHQCNDWKKYVKAYREKVIYKDLKLYGKKQRD